MSEKVFKLPALGKFAQVFPLLIGAVLPLLVITIAMLANGTDPHWVHALPAILTLPIVAALLAWHMHSRKVELLPGQLRVRGWPIPRSFNMEGMDLEQARVLDLGQESSLQPMVKLAGSRMPGFRSGWFWLRDGRKSYVLSTTSSRVLYLPRKDGNVLLLGVERPDALLQSLRDESSQRS